MKYEAGELGGFCIDLATSFLEGPPLFGDLILGKSRGDAIDLPSIYSLSLRRTGPKPGRLNTGAPVALEAIPAATRLTLSALRGSGSGAGLPKSECLALEIQSPSC